MQIKPHIPTGARCDRDYSLFFFLNYNYVSIFSRIVFDQSLELETSIKTDGFKLINIINLFKELDNYYQNYLVIGKHFINLSSEQYFKKKERTVRIFRILDKKKKKSETKKS